MSSSGTSLAFQRAKEHPNRSSGVEVMTENVKWTRLILGESCARGSRTVDTGSHAHGTRTEDTGSPETSWVPVGTGWGARGHGVDGKFVIFLSNSMGERKIGVWGRNRS